MKRRGWLLALPGAALTVHAMAWRAQQDHGLFVTRQQGLAWFAVAVCLACGLLIWRRRPGAASAFVLLAVACVPPSVVVLDHLGALWAPLEPFATYAGWALPALLLLVHPDGTGGRPLLLGVAYVAIPGGLALLATVSYLADDVRGAPIADSTVALDVLQGWVLVAMLAASGVATARWWRARGFDRNARSPVAVAGLLWVATQALVIVMTRLAAHGVLRWSGSIYVLVAHDLALLTLLALVAAVGWVELLQPRLARTHAGVLTLPADASAGGLGDAEGEVRRALRDPAAVLLYRGAGGGLVTAGGGGADEAPGSVTTWLERDGERIGAIRHAEALVAEPETLRLGAVIAAAAVDNHRLHALTLARLDATREAAARMLEADGHARDALAAKVLAGPVARLGEALARLGDGHDVEALAEVQELLRRALEEVRGLAHASVPPRLAGLGLARSLPEVLAARGADVQLEDVTAARFEPVVEATVHLLVEAAGDAAANGSVSAQVTDVLGGVAVVVAGVGTAVPPALRDRLSALGAIVTDDPPRWYVTLPSRPATG